PRRSPERGPRAVHALGVEIATMGGVLPQHDSSAHAVTDDGRSFLVARNDGGGHAGVCPHHGSVGTNSLDEDVVVVAAVVGPRDDRAAGAVAGDDRFELRPNRGADRNPVRGPQPVAGCAHALSIGPIEWIAPIEP